MYKYYPQILGIVDTLNDWDKKLQKMLDGKTDNVFIGTLIIVGLIIIAFWGIGALNKKQ